MITFDQSISQPPWFIFLPSYWFPNKKKSHNDSGDIGIEMYESTEDNVVNDEKQACLKGERDDRPVIVKALTSIVKALTSTAKALTSTSTALARH